MGFLCTARCTAVLLNRVRYTGITLKWISLCRNFVTVRVHHSGISLYTGAPCTGISLHIKVRYTTEDFVVDRFFLAEFFYVLGLVIP